MGSFAVKQAGDLLDAEFTAKWRDRRVALDAPLTRKILREILERFILSGGPVQVGALARLLPEHAPGEVAQAVTRLDEEDMILVEDAHVTLAYPFASALTAFTVFLPGGRERYAVCAIDAVGIAPMLGQPVTVRSHCYHCGELLEMAVHPDGPVGRTDMMVWVGTRGDLRQKACASICQTINFFSSAAHLQSWWDAHPDTPGAAAVLDDAFALGASVFGALLRDTGGVTPLRLPD